MTPGLDPPYPDIFRGIDQNDPVEAPLDAPVEDEGGINHHQAVTRLRANHRGPQPGRQAGAHYSLKLLPMVPGSKDQTAEPPSIHCTIRSEYVRPERSAQLVGDLKIGKGLVAKPIRIYYRGAPFGEQSAQSGLAGPDPSGYSHKHPAPIVPARREASRHRGEGGD